MAGRMCLRTSGGRMCASASVRQLWRFRYVRPDAATTLASRGWTFRSRLLESLSHAVQVAADSGHGRVVEAKGRLRDINRQLQLHPGTLQIPEVLQHAAEVAAPGGHARVVRVEG